MGTRRGKSRAERRASPPPKAISAAAAKPSAAIRTVLDVVLPIAVSALFFVLVWEFYPFHQVSEFDPDEGNNLIKARLLARGHQLYSETWSDQPPLFTYMLRGWFALAGWSAHSARIFVLICSCGLLWSLYQIVRPAWGHGGAIASVFLLATTWRYVPLSVSVMLAIPTLMLAMLSVYFATRYRTRRHAAWLVASGVFLALSFFTKLLALPLAPLIVLIVLLPRWSKHGTTEGQIRPQGHNPSESQSADRRSSFRIPHSAFRIWSGLAVWLIGFAAAAAILFVALIPWSEIDQLLRPHLDARRQMDRPGWDKVYLDQLRADWLYVLFGAIGLVHVIRRREWRSLVPVAWYGLSALVLARHRPLWYHHYVLLSVPLCWMAASALGPALSLRTWRELWPPRNAARWIGLAACAATVVLLAAALGQARGKLERERQYAEQFIRITPRDDYLVAVLEQLAEQTRSVITDRQMLPFRAGLIVPPELSVTSMKRFESGHLSSERLLELIEQYKPEQVLLSFRHVQRIRPTAEFYNYLKSSYRLIYSDPAGDLLYVLPDLAEAAPAALLRALVQVPDSDDAWYNWGLTLAAQGKHGEAVAAFSRSAEMRPAAATYEALARSYNALGRAEEAGEAQSRADRLKRLRR